MKALKLIVVIFFVSLFDASAASVSCGGHYASSCTQCPRGRGSGYCNGVCNWCHGMCQTKKQCPGSVWCGGHSASSCSQCPKGRGSGYCNGECQWCSGTCKTKLQCTGHALLLGSYGLKFTVRSKSTMNFDIRANGYGGKNVKITKCSFSCVRMMDRPLVASTTSTYPASDGWMEASQILAPQITMYFKKTNSGGIKTLYHNSNNGVTSEGTAVINLDAVAGSHRFANQYFYIYNYAYPKARLAQYDSSSEVGSFDGSFNKDQVWKLEPVTGSKEHYYIINAANPTYRLTSRGKNSFLAYSGGRHNDQIWKFVSAGSGYYYIYNYQHSKYRIGKWGSEGADTGVHDGGFSNDQKWKLVPEFRVQIRTITIFHVDNRQGSKPIKKTIKVTKGVKRSSTKTITNTQTYTQSVELSMSAALDIFSLGMTMRNEFSSQISQSFSTTVEKSWQKEISFTFTIPARKNYKIMQHEVRFIAKNPAESCSMKSGFQTFESSYSWFSDPDRFVVNKN